MFSSVRLQTEDLVEPDIAGDELRVYLKNMRDYADGLYVLRIPVDWVRMPVAGRVPPGTLDPYLRCGLEAMEHPLAGQHRRMRRPWEPQELPWGHDVSGSLVEVLEPEDLQVSSGLDEEEVRAYGIIRLHGKGEDDRIFRYDLYGRCLENTHWVKLCTLDLGPGTQWKGRWWLAWPLYPLTIALDLPLTLLRFMFHGPGLPDPTL